MDTSLVHIYTSDGLKLPALHYKSKGDKVAIYLHGNGTSSIFYSSYLNLLGKSLVKNNISFFPFNNRGAHLIKRYTIKNTHKQVFQGTAFEKIKDCIKDIDAAVNYLKNEGYSTLYLIGHSTGANKAVLYQFEKNQYSPFSKIILLGPGDDTGLYFQKYGKTLFYKAIKTCKEKIESSKGLSYVPKYLSTLPYSYQGLYDVVYPDGDYNIFPFFEYSTGKRLGTKKLFCEYASINISTLTLIGELDHFVYPDAKIATEILKKIVKNSPLHSYKIMSGAPHDFEGSEEELVNEITSFLA